jgi:hypothetical protein
MEAEREVAVTVVATEAAETVAATAGAAMVSAMVEVAKEVEERAPGTPEKSYPERGPRSQSRQGSRRAVPRYPRAPT